MRRTSEPQSDFKLGTGVHVTDLSGIREGYAVKETAQYSLITANVSADRLEETFLGLARLVNTPGYAIIEVPVNQEIEEALRTSDADPFHKDVYYMDGIDFEILEVLFTSNLGLLVNDGGINFGFGSHQGYDEVFVGRYKFMQIYTKEPDKYTRELQRLGYEQRDPLRTVWDNISPNTPGYTELLTIEGENIYDLVERLVGEGFYFVERRED